MSWPKLDEDGRGSWCDAEHGAEVFEEIRTRKEKWKMCTPIMLTDVIKIADVKQYKLHLACANEERTHPLNEYAADRNEWVRWNEWRGEKNDWTLPYIFSFIEYFPIANTYLFGGIFSVKERLPNRYVLQEVESFSKWEGRLICRFQRDQVLRGRAYRLESLMDSLEVHSILPERYNGERFCGYHMVNHSFAALRPILLREKQDWKSSLVAVKGVYLVLDTSNGKPYVGSAYGDAGIWSRLSCYINTGHGWNDGLVKTIKEKGVEYALENFKFSILDVFAFNTSDGEILAREAHWKNVMLSRQYGYNMN